MFPAGEGEGGDGEGVESGMGREREAEWAMKEAVDIVGDVVVVLKVLFSRMKVALWG